MLATREVQRLRNVRQLGFTSLVFPGAEHSRFAHSVGAAHVMVRLLTRMHAVRAALPRELVVDDEAEADVLAAVLLHDLGHGPFSHLFEEVLPAIRKTGAYAVPGTLAALPALTHDRVSAILLIGDAVAKVPGVKSGIAMAATLTCIHENTGLAVETLRRTLPAANEPICSLNATQLGKLLNRSAKATNQLLALQSRQAMQAQQLQITQDRATALEQARQVAVQERAREVRRRFQGTGTPYTATAVSFYGN